MEKLYSIVICPPAEEIQEVKRMKELLSSKIKWYNSKNSEAHITFNNFYASDNILLHVEQKLEDFCRGLKPFPLSFVKTGHFSNGAFFLYPDESSKEKLIHVMKMYRLIMPFKSYGTFDPHISIGRKLNPNQLATAIELFSTETIDIRFVFERLTIRKFNEQISQYEVYKHFTF